MSNLIAARVQMGNSLGFHIIFSVLSIGMPLLLCIAEGLALWHKDPVWMAIARRWSKAVALIFIIGAVSGTVISFELSLLWPSYINFTGSIVGPLFAIEGIFFFIEAIFWASTSTAGIVFRRVLTGSVLSPSGSLALLPRSSSSR